MIAIQRNKVSQSFSTHCFFDDIKLPFKVQKTLRTLGTYRSYNANVDVFSIFVIHQIIIRFKKNSTKCKLFLAF